jgi:hypothetical protein
VASAQNLFRIVEIDVLLYFNLAAISKTFVSVSAPVQPIEKATFFEQTFLYSRS